jgi:O-antigen/teichoic acid export membrane protein
LLQDIKHTLKQSAIYGFSRISTKLLGLILLPIITLNLTVSEFGIYVLAESLWQVFWAIFTFGLESGIVRWYLEVAEPKKKKVFLFSVYLFLFVLNFLLIIIIYLLSPSLSKLVFENIVYTKFILYSSLIAFAEAFTFTIFLQLRIEEKVKSYTILAILTTVISLVLQVYFLQYSQIKLEGIFIAKIITPVSIIIILLPYLIKHFKIGFDKLLITALLKYSFPIMVAGLILTLLNQIDRYILSYLTDLSKVGIFGLANGISGLVNFLIISPFVLSFTVISWKKLNDENAKRFYTKTVTYLFLSVIYISIFISLFIPHLIKILTMKTDYWAAASYVPWVILAMPFYGIHFIGVFSFYVTKKTKYIFYSYTIALLSKIILNFVFIPFLGVLGAAIVNLVSFALLTIMIYIYSRTNYFYDYEWNKIIKMLVSYSLLVFPFFYINFESRVIEILLKIVAAGIFPFLLYILNFYEKIEIQRIKGFLNKYLKLNLS